MVSAIAMVVAELLGTAAVAVAVFFLLRRLLAAETAMRYANAIALAVAFCAGYALLPVSTAAWVPKRHWHWFPWLALLAAMIGPISLAGGLRLGERWLLNFGVAIVAAWMLVPLWPHLQPTRLVWVPFLAGYLFLLAVLLEPLLGRFSAVTMPAYLTLSAACVALLIAALLSVTYGHVAGIAVAALAGRGGAAYFEREANSVRGLSLVYAVLVGGWAFVGCIEPQQPQYLLLLVPAAPLALWCCVYGPLARLRGFAAVGVQTALVLLVLTIATGLLVGVGSGEDEGEEYGRFRERVREYRRVDFSQLVAWFVRVQHPGCCGAAGVLHDKMDPGGRARSSLQ